MKTITKAQLIKLLVDSLKKESPEFLERIANLVADDVRIKMINKNKFEMYEMYSHKTKT